MFKNKNFAVYNHRMFKTKLRRELFVIILIKLTLLYGLWSICFKHDKRHVTGEELAQTVYGLTN